ncbi:MAG: hypothetical protein LBD88_01920 [Candidatus Peribacteria bacterium]|nr:hypothetical protein [Candidatus Peribacteria bacterium]
MENLDSLLTEEEIKKFFEMVEMFCKEGEIFLKKIELYKEFEFKNFKNFFDEVTTDLIMVYGAIKYVKKNSDKLLGLSNNNKDYILNKLESCVI